MQADQNDPRQQARILIGVPAYRGAAHIGETLRSIQEQDFQRIRRACVRGRR